MPRRGSARRSRAGTYDLVLAARDEPRLREAAAGPASTYGVTVEALPADLTTADGLAAVAVTLALDRPNRMIVAGIRVTPKRLPRTVARDTRCRIRHPPR